MKKYLSLFLVLFLFCSMMSVYALEVDPTDYVEDENGNLIEYTEPTESTGPIEVTEPEKTDEELFEEYMASINLPTPEGPTGDVSQTPDSDFGNTETAPEYTPDYNGEATIFVKIEVENDFYDNIAVGLTNRDTQEEIIIPVYATNKWEAMHSVPAGDYLVYYVAATGDDPMNPEYNFDLNSDWTFQVEAGSSYTISAKQVVKEEENIQDTTTPPPCDPDNITDTEMQPEDFMTQEEIDAMNKEELTTWDHVKNLFKELFSPANLFLLLILGGSCIAYLIYKKKQNED